MIEKIFIDKTPDIEKMDSERRKRFIEYFSNAPIWLLDNMNVEQVEKGVRFIQEGEPAKSIYFLVTGVVEAIDLRIYGVPFNFKEFRDIHAFGGMEVVLNENEYRTTLQTVTKCVFIKISRPIFEKWLCSDVDALMREARLITKNLLEEGRMDRLFALTQGNDRLALLFLKQYEYYSIGGTLVMHYSRRSIADATGLCEKTVSRGMKFFEENGFITKEKSVITINEKQYEELRERVAKIIEL